MAAIAVSLSSCKDDLEFPEFGDGEALVKCEVKFTPLISALSSRAPGNAIKTIDNLHVLIYNSDDLLIANYTKDDLLNYQSSADENSSLTPNTGLPSGNIGSGSHNNPNTNPEKAEEETPRVTFSIPS
ncbi:MAG: hypothetical protein K2M57_03115, partial [Paramuribaculum sp.]|nr:hypothetical protein [Paramuribaculum sp.]